MNVFLTVLSLLFCTALAGTAADSPAEEFPSGVVQELWFGIPGGSVKDLTHQKVFERPSSDIRKIVRLDAENLGDQYGARYSALLRVPATGEYRLYLSSDDSAELWLGKDATQKDMSCIATVKGYSDRHNWTNQPNQSSEPVHLEAGKFYFLQVIHKEDGGPTTCP
ncbi:MAG: PA14 domain-containing protein [Akkermansia sp.]